MILCTHTVLSEPVRFALILRHFSTRHSPYICVCICVCRYPVKKIHEIQTCVLTRRSEGIYFLKTNSASGLFL